MTRPYGIAIAAAIVLHASFSFAENRSPQPPIVLAQAETGNGLSYADMLMERARVLLDARGQERNPALAARILTDAASTGSVSAMLLLAELYRKGDGVEKDVERAIGLLNGAIAAGSVKDGAFALAGLYRSADPPDAERAVAAYEQAADAGNTWAMLSLAEMLVRGDLVPVDRDRARSLIERAISSGNVRDGAYALGNLYRGANPPDMVSAVKAYEQAMAAGDDGAALTLARIFLRGEGVPADPARALSLIESAIAAGNVGDGSVALGNFYRSQEPPDYAKAATAFEQAINAGETWGLLALAEMVRRGEGMKPDFARAKGLIEQAIVAGNVDGGAAMLGDLYRQSAPPDRDPLKAAEAYQQAIDAGNTGVMLVLAEMLRVGDGIPVDLARSKSLIEESIAAGNSRDGKVALGDFLRRSDPPDMAGAVACYEEAVELGSVSAMLSLAEVLRAGNGVSRDLARAEALIEQSIAAGDVENGAYALGNFRLKADTPDAAGAAQAFEQSAEAGSSQAMLALADLLVAGKGIGPDPARAKSLIERAIAAGEVRYGSVALATLLRRSSPPDMPGAVAAYEQAIAAGDLGAMLSLAGILRRGDGVPADPDRAKALIEESIAMGNVSDGKLALGEFYRLSGQPSQAATAYQQAIDAGNEWAMLALAQLVRDGEGVPFDFDRARDLIVASIESGNVAAGAVALGDLYRQSDPPYRDLNKALDAYRQAVDAGDPGAMLDVADMLRRGEGAPADVVQAKALIEQSIAAGNVADGTLALGDFYRQSDPPQPSNAMAAYERAIAAGSTWGMLALADMLNAGDGTPPDPDRAKALIEAAIADGNVYDGAFALGDFYRLSAPPQVENALAAYEQAAAAGNANANLMAARVASARYSDARGRERMVRNLTAAAAAFSAREVALEMIRLPSEPLIAAVQQLLADSGERVGVPDGYHGAHTKRAIRDFCQRKAIADCDENFITISLIEALLEPPSITQ